MGLTLSSVFGRLFGKKQMRILMGNFPLLLHGNSSWLPVLMMWTSTYY